MAVEQGVTLRVNSNPKHATMQGIHQGCSTKRTGIESSEDDDIRNLLTPGVDLNPTLSTKVEEYHRKTFGNFTLTHCPRNTATWCIFARDCMWAFQTSRIVETCTRGCQNSSFSNTFEILNELIWSLHENEQSEEPFCATEVHFQAKV